MVKLKGPLLSMEARGSLGKVLNFQQRKSGAQVRQYNKPPATPTPLQRSHRRLNEFATIQWLCMSDATKATWAASAKTSGLNLSGYHYFLREALRDPYTHSGLVLFVPMNEIVANQAQDLSGNGIHFDLKPTPPADAPRLAAGFKDKFGRSLLFDGTNEYLRADFKARLDVTLKLYIEYWINVTFGSTQTVFQQWYAAAGDDPKFLLQMLDVAKPKVYFQTTGGLSALTNSTALAAGLHCVGLNWDGTTSRFFIDGRPDATTAATTAPLEASSAKPWIGNYEGGSEWLNGRLAQLVYYNRNLSNAEILKRYSYACRGIPSA